jgi:hypothetical protein
MNIFRALEGWIKEMTTNPPGSVSPWDLPASEELTEEMLGEVSGVLRYVAVQVRAIAAALAVAQPPDAAVLQQLVTSITDMEQKMSVLTDEVDAAVTQLAAAVTSAQQAESDAQATAAAAQAATATAVAATAVVQSSFDALTATDTALSAADAANVAELQVALNGLNAANAALLALGQPTQPVPPAPVTGP